MVKTKSALKLLCSVATLISTCHSWSSQETTPRRFFQTTTTAADLSRRDWFQNTLALTSAVLIATPSASVAAEASAAAASAAEVTDKIFMDLKGLPSSEGIGTKRIVIGLFGKEAPQSVGKLKQLMSSGGLPSLCKPKEERMLQREQLESNKVYNSCIEGQDRGVTYDYAQIWRVVKGERIDFGSVAGKFIPREYPTWEENSSTTNNNNSIKYDRAGIVSVRKGNDSGFGFSVYPGGRAGDNIMDTADLDENHIVVGQVLEGLDIIQELNNIPVITSAKVNYMGLTGGPNTKSAPSRSCRYGGPMYCNENKPLVKLTIYNTGVL